MQIASTQLYKVERSESNILNEHNLFLMRHPNEATNEEGIVNWPFISGESKTISSVFWDGFSVRIFQTELQQLSAEFQNF